MQPPKLPCHRPARRSRLDVVLEWYRRWVRVREARYRYLAAILDGSPVPTLEPARVKKANECTQSGDQA